MIGLLGNIRSRRHPDGQSILVRLVSRLCKETDIVHKLREVLLKHRNGECQHWIMSAFAFRKHFQTCIIRCRQEICIVIPFFTNFLQLLKASQGSWRRSVFGLVCCIVLSECGVLCLNIVVIGQYYELCCPAVLVSPDYRYNACRFDFIVIRVQFCPCCRNA
ncbi:hypothetical protein D3C80_1443260 [compost metagenome]